MPNSHQVPEQECLNLLAFCRRNATLSSANEDVLEWVEPITQSNWIEPLVVTLPHTRFSEQPSGGEQNR
ncbi:MAG TPA: hypothetical protein V6C95_13795 [Coleofasciculaceae cyanobacterium]